MELNSNLNKSFLAIIFLVFPLLYVILFQNFVTAISGLGVLSYIDEIFIVVIFLILALRVFFLQKVDLAIVWLLFAFVYMTLVSFIGINFDLRNVILQNIIHLKFFVFIFAFRWIFKYYPKILKQLFLSIFSITLLGVFLNLIFQDQFNNWLDFEIIYRNGLLRLVGFSSHPNNIGATLGIFYIYYLFRERKRITFLKFSLETLVFIVLVILIGSRTPLLVVPIAFWYFLVQNFGKKLRVMLVSVSLMVLSILILTLKETEIYDKTATNISQTVSAEDSHYTRGLLLYYSVVISATNFPIGSGSASFGTKFSEGSKVYQKYGLTSRYFTEMQGVYDSNVASILGEFGIMGFIIFGFLLVLTIRKLKKSADHVYDIHYFMSMIISMLVFSFTMPVFMNTYPAMLFAIALVVWSINNKQVSLQKEANSYR